MAGWLKIVLLILGVLFLVGVGLTITAIYWVRANHGKLEAHARQLTDDGRRYGEGKTLAACVDESLRREKADPGIMNGMRNQIFLAACASKAAPSPELCADTPAPDEIIASARWSVIQCKRRGLENDAMCRQAFTLVAQKCHDKASK